MTATPESHIGRYGALKRWSQVAPADRTEATKPGRDAFLRRFENEPDPEAARRAYFAGLAMRKALKRKKAQRRSAA